MKPPSRGEPLDQAVVAARLAACRIVVRPTTDDAAIRRIAALIERGDVKPVVGLKVRIFRSSEPGGIDIATDPNADPRPMARASLLAILQHAVETPPTHARDARDVILAHAAAGDVQGIRRGGTSLGLSAATPWSQAMVAGHGRGWNGYEDPSDDLPCAYRIEVSGNDLSLDPITVLDRPERLLPDAMDALRALRRWNAGAIHRHEAQRPTIRSNREKRNAA